MNIRPKTMRRLLLLFAVMMLIGGVIALLFARSVRRNERALRKLHDEAMAAYQAGDYEKAVDKLGVYRDKASNRPADPQTEFAYAESRIHVEMPNRKHISEGIHAFEQYLLTIKPGDSAAQLELLRLYVMEGYRPEAIRLADDMLAVNASSPEVLELKAAALSGQGQKSEALAVSQKLNEIAPLNLRAQLETVRLMAELNMPADAVIAHAQALQKSHENDPRFDVLLACAYQEAKQEEQATNWMKTAARHDPPDAQFVGELVAQLDHSDLNAEADAFLARSADVLADVKVQRLYAQRLWQDLKVAVLADRLKDQDPANPASDSALLGYRALALYGQDKVADARALVAGLGRRGDATALGWTIALRAEDATPPLKGPDLAMHLQRSVARDPANPVLREMLAEAYLKLEESDLAIQQCIVALDRSPSWWKPYVLMAQAQTTTGRQGEALNSARLAAKCLPTREAQVMLAKCYYAWTIESGLDADYTNLLALLESIHTAWHDAETLPLYVTVLARTGKREQAIEVVKEALASETPLPTPVLVSLANVSDAEKLNCGMEVRAYTQKTRGLTPELAASQARGLLEAGRKSEGLQLLMDAAKGHESELPWRVALASYRESAGMEDALKNWIALGDQYPGDLQLQQVILRAPSRVKDRAFWARTIDRVKSLTGDEGQLWQIERSRLMLSGQLNERDISEAVNLLTQVTRTAPTLAEPHGLLALAMEKLNNEQGAISELSLAADSHSSDPAITRELVRLLLANHRAADAVSYLDKLAQNHALASEVRRWLAGTYADMGYNDRALMALQGDSEGGVERDRMLAKLDRRLGRMDEAATLYKSLMQESITDAPFWVEAADFFASRQEMATANSCMEKLTALTLGPGELEVWRAQFAERWQGDAAAVSHYQAATTSAPQLAAGWAGLAGFELRRDRFSDAAVAARQGLQALPGNSILKALQSHAQTLGGLAGAKDLQTLIDILGSSPLDGGANDMLAAAAAAQSGHLSAAQTAQKLREVADRNPQNLALQVQAARTLVQARRFEDAASLARRAADNNPTSAEPQRLLVGICAASGDWSGAEQAALLWLQRAPEQAKAANLALAEIYLQQPNRDSAGALRVLAPYVPPDAPASNPPALKLYVKALVLEDRATEAATLVKPLMEPMLADSPTWRGVWLDLAAAQKDADAAAAWIGQAVPLIPADAPAEQCALATAWYGVGSQMDSPTALENASKTLQPLLADPHAAPQVWFAAGLTAQAQGDYAAAEKSYRRVLEMDPHSPDAMNNLAYLLWLRGQQKDMAEARRLSESAVATRSDDASLYDTLARIEATMGESAAATKTFRTALQFNPSSLEAMIGLADLLSRNAASREEARDLLTQIQRLMQTKPRLSSDLRKQYQSARDAVASSN